MRYLTLVRPLGGGGFSEVWETRNANKPNEPHTALKLFTQKDAAEHARKEADNIERVHHKYPATDDTGQPLHPGLARLEQSYPHNNPPGLLYELVSGGSLRNLLGNWHRSGAPPSPAQAARIVFRLCEILSPLHANGDVHRDLKPENILIQPGAVEGEKAVFKITDLGLSRIAPASGTVPGTRSRRSRMDGSGTPGYMAPEQARQRFDSSIEDAPTMDVFSLGVILFELIEGELPSGSLSDGMKEDLREKSVPEEMIRLMAACLESKPRRRPQTAGDLAERLGPFLEKAKTITSSADDSFRVSLPSEKRQGIIDAADALMKEGKNSPQNMARILEKIAPKILRKYSASTWNAFKVSNTNLEENPNWAQIYEEIDNERQESEAAAEYPASVSIKPQEEQWGKILEFSLPYIVPNIVRSGIATTLRLRPIPAGKFKMGSPKSEVGRHSNEDQVDVTIWRPFWLAESPFTQAQWQAAMGALPDCVPREEKLPVGNVSWKDCQQCLTKLNEIFQGKLPSGYRFALPTEAQWEYACRAGTTTAFHCGNDLDSAMANFNESYPGGEGKTGIWRRKTTVKSFPPNNWGVHDMHGSVWEWCADWYGEKLPGGTDPGGPDTSTQRVLRGGCWDDHGRDCRSAARNRSAPYNRNILFGFLPALEAIL